MASAPSKREREVANAAYLKMRSDYRARRVELPIVYDPDDFVDITQTILDGPRLVANQKLTVGIPHWANLPPRNGSDTAAAPG